MLSSASTRKMLRFVAFQVVASTIDGAPVYSIADILEPLPQYNGKLLRSARKTAGGRGYVLIGRASLPWVDFEASARCVEGIY